MKTRLLLGSAVLLVFGAGTCCTPTHKPKTETTAGDGVRECVHEGLRYSRGAVVETRTGSIICTSSGWKRERN
jgi:hypothetical protein